jgi:hypothetical protein
VQKLILRVLALVIIGCSFLLVVPHHHHHTQHVAATPTAAATRTDHFARASRSFDRPAIDMQKLKAMQARRLAHLDHLRFQAHLRAVRRAEAQAAAAQAAAQAAAARQVAITPSPAAPAPTYSSSGHNWDGVAQCESGGNWHINTGNGYYGGLQFSLSTWQSMGGSGLPSDASRETQIAIAERVLAAVHGNWQSQWPVCGRYL